MATITMKNMRRPAEKAKSRAEIGSTPDSANRYPYGIQLDLNDETLKMLGMDTPKLGQKFVIMATGEVTSVHESERVGSSPHRSAEIQIKRLGLEPMKTGKGLKGMPGGS